MRAAFAACAAGAVLCWAGNAVADLYRWVDPESGSVKFSSYPPPWYGDPVKSRRAPKVELIPSERPSAAAKKAAAAQAKPAAAAPKVEDGDGTGPLETLRKELLRKLGAPTGAEFQRAGDGLKQQLEAYDTVAAELDRMDPKGAARRRAESQSVLDKVREGLRAQFGTQPPVPLK